MISEKNMLCYGVHVSSSWWCMYVPRVSANKAYKKKNCLQELPILLALDYYTFMCTCDFYRYGHIILRKEGISKQDTCEDDFNLIRILAACISGYIKFLSK